MVTIVTRSGKGSALTNTEIDTNFTNLNTGKVEDVTARATYLPSLLLDFANGKSLDPRVSFSRASTATYYDGVTVAKAEENLLLQSQALLANGWFASNGYVGSLGSELISNGTFDSNIAGWSNVSSGTGTVGWDGGTIKLTTVTDWQNRAAASTPITTIVGRYYVARGTVTAAVGGTGDVGLKAGTSPGSQQNLYIGAYPGGVGTTQVAVFLATATTTYISLLAQFSAGSVNFDDISVKEVSADNVVAPDSTSTAATATAVGPNATFTQSVSLGAASYTFSVWLKRTTGTGNVDITCDSAGTWVTQTITSSWARYTITQTLASGTRNPGIRIATSGDQVQVWGAQLEQRSSATAYTATTTAAITNYIPQLLTAAANTPRFHHDPVTGESLGLLIEEQRTNLFTYSQDFASVATSTTGITFAANTVVAPDGTLTGTKMVETSAASWHYASSSRTVSANTTYTYSIFAKAGERTTCFINFPNDTKLSRFNLSTGALISADAGVTAYSVSVGNGWYRLICTYTTGASETSINPVFGLQTFEYQGDGFSGAFIWGAQVEAGSFATSYIATTASQVTRSADSASMTGTNFSSWYNPSEGTLSGEASRPALGGNSPIATVFSATNTRMQVGNNTGGGGTAEADFYVQNAGADQAFLRFASAVTANVPFKIVGAYNLNNFGASANGAATLTDTSGTVPVATSFLIGASGSAGNAFNGTIRRITYYPVRLSNADLQSLTA